MKLSERIKTYFGFVKRKIAHTPKKLWSYIKLIGKREKNFRGLCRFKIFESLSFLFLNIYYPRINLSFPMDPFRKKGEGKNISPPLSSGSASQDRGGTGWSQL
ncbi:MAG: hypothetical protein V1890_02625 [Candidatus Zixiibacteriota bacterium]